MNERALLRLALILVGLIIVFVLTALLYAWLPEKSPYTLFQFWRWDTALDGIMAAWPLYLWAIVLHVAMNFFKFNGYTVTPGETLVAGALISLWAGVTEELYFRWLLYLIGIMSVQLGAWLLGGFMGLDWIQWLHLHVFLPVANFFTFGYLEEYLFHAGVWAAGAAILYSNGKFRNGHAYQGHFGLVHAWFGGMYLFWIMFHYGLPAAIGAHVIFDFLCYATVAVDVAIEERMQPRRRLRW